MPELTPAIPRVADRIELLERPEGLEAVVAGQRRLRLSAEAAWLIGQLDGRLTVDGIAERLEARLGHPVSPAQARELLERTLITHGIATFEPVRRGRPVRRHRVRVLHPAAQVGPVARSIAVLAHPVTMLVLSGGALFVLARAFATATLADWRAPLGWILALPLAAFSLWAHEWLHAAAFVRGGGVPGPITFTQTAAFRFTTELPDVRRLPRAARLIVDIAGVYAQWVIAGSVAALAMANGTPLPMPALSAVLVLIAINLLPQVGSDGTWFVQDLFEQTAGDQIVRWPRARRALELLRLRLTIEGAARTGRDPASMISRVLPTMLAMSFPDAKPAWLRRVARDNATSRLWFVRDGKAIADGERPEQIHRISVIRRLRQEGRGALVCSMHLGPFPYVPIALAELGCPVMAYAAEGVRSGVESSWLSAAAHQGAQFEALTATSSRDALRAVRGMRDGKFLVLYMDGQFSASRDQHRADFRFLGQELYMRTGPALLAASAGVPIVLAACYWDGLGRRIVTFSDPLPPPESRQESAIIATTESMYRWFEPIVAARPGQWPGWAWPIQHWRRTGNSPTTTREAFEQAIRVAADALRGEQGNARLVAETTRSQWIEMQGEHLLIDGPGRRVLAASKRTCDVLDGAHRRMRLRELPRHTGQSVDALAVEVARLTLSNVARIEP